MAFIVTAKHVSPLYSLDSVTFADAQYTPNPNGPYARMIHNEQYVTKMNDGRGGFFYSAYASRFGCSKSHGTARAAIFSLLADNGCYSIQIKVS